MEKNNSSEKSQQFTGKDANDIANKNVKSQHLQNEENKNRDKSNSYTGTDNHNEKAATNLGKGTGMSSEANSSQNEESWQGTGGSMANEAQMKNANEGYDNNRKSKNQDMSTTSNISSSGKYDKMNLGSQNIDAKNKHDKNNQDNKKETLTDSYNQSKNKN